jgi:hypothetical protein
MDPVTTAAGLNPSMALSAATAFGGGIASYFSGREANEANVAMQRETNAQNMQMFRINAERDDNAVQRRVQDLQRAGLSPVLAAGSAAGVSSPIKMDAPRVDGSYVGNAYGNLIQGALAASQLAKTKADISNVVANTSKTETDQLAVDQNMEQQLLMNNFQSKAISASTYRDQMETLRKKYELERDKKYGVGERSTGATRQTQDILSGAETAAKSIVVGGGDKRQQEYAKDPGKGSMGDIWKKTFGN